MTRPPLRNGVLLSSPARRAASAILGDQGIHQKVPPGFWDEIAAKLTIRFKNGEFTDGIVETINAAGEHLKQYFPAPSAT